MAKSPTSYIYAREKFMKAIEILATHPGDVRARLEEAYQQLLVLNEKDFPKKLRKDWHWIRNELTKKGPGVPWPWGSVSPVRNTLSKMRNATGAKIAKKILYLYGELS
jgi:hypothetical protein